jgi:hypothetical protein
MKNMKEKKTTLLFKTFGTNTQILVVWREHTVRPYWTVL